MYIISCVNSRQPFQVFPNNILIFFSLRSQYLESATLFNLNTNVAIRSPALVEIKEHVIDTNVDPS